MAPENAALSHRYLFLSMAMMVCLLVIINVSFKIVIIDGFMFSATSLLSPLLALIYFQVLKHYNEAEQRLLLNQSLVALYLFSIGVYFLINLPPAEYMHGNRAYQVVYTDIPKKFFAATFAFGLSFYLPQCLSALNKKPVALPLKQAVLRSLLGGFAFFVIDFIVLFSETLQDNFIKTFIDSSLITAALILITMTWGLVLTINKKKYTPKNSDTFITKNHRLYHLFLAFSVIITLVCLACEYRLVNFYNIFNMEASSVLFPLILITSSLTHALFGNKANTKLIIIVIATELIFNVLMIGLIALPSPHYFNLTYFYKIIMPRRMLTSAFALFCVLMTNNMILTYLEKKTWLQPAYLRFFIANILAITLLWGVNETIIFSAVYPKELVNHLALTGFFYKLIIALIALPFMMTLLRAFQCQLNNSHTASNTVRTEIEASPSSGQDVSSARSTALREASMKGPQSLG